MSAIRSFTDLSDRCRGQRRSVAVVCGHDDHSLTALGRAWREGLIDPVFVGTVDEVRRALPVYGIAESSCRFVAAQSESEAAAKAVALVRGGEAGVLVKGLIPSPVLLRAVLDREGGLLPEGGVLTHMAVAEIAGRGRLLCFTDAAVIPFPTPAQRVAQLERLIALLHALGVAVPEVALVHCSETLSERFPLVACYPDLCRRAEAGEWGRAVVDGPLDLLTACHHEALAVKGIASRLTHDADGLVLPDIEAANVLYKALPLFGGARMAGLLSGTVAPVVLPSRGDAAEAKYHSLLLALASLRG